MSALTGFLAALVLAPTAPAARPALSPAAEIRSSSAERAIAAPFLALIPFASPMMMQPASSAGLAATWKIISRMNGGGGGLSFTTLNEVQWVDSTGTAISTSGATHTASTAQSGTVNDLFDGNSGTFYQTATVLDAFVQTVFASAVTVAGVKLTSLVNFADRAPTFFDVYYNLGAGDVYLFTGAYNAWTAASQTITFMDPGAAAAQTDWFVMPTALNGGAGWFQSELEFRASLGGADEATGGTAISGYDFNFDVVSKLFDNSTATFAGATSLATTPYVFAGYQIPTAKDILQVSATSRDSSTSQAMTAGRIYAGANRGYRLRKTFSGLTWGAAPSTNLINL